MSGLVRLSGPDTEPVSLEEAKLHLRVDGDQDDGLIAALIVSAREIAEKHLNRALVRQQWRMVRDQWPAGALRFPFAPLIAVDAVRVADAAGDFQILAPDIFIVNSHAEPGLMVLKSGALWPRPGQKIAGIEIDFTAGYGDSWNDVPAAIRQGLLQRIAHFYETRGAEGDIPGNVLHIWQPFKVMRLA